MTVLERFVYSNDVSSKDLSVIISYPYSRNVRILDI